MNGKTLLKLITTIIQMSHSNGTLCQRAVDLQQQQQQQKQHRMILPYETNPTIIIIIITVMMIIIVIITPSIHITRRKQIQEEVFDGLLCDQVS